MIPSQLLPFANHLWQSTWFAAAAALLTLLLRKNRAHVRYWLWLSASVKFLVPFSILVDLGSLLGRHTTAVIAPTTLAPAAGLSFAVEQVGEPFTRPVTQATSYADVIVPALIAVWAIGFASLVCRWALRWWRMRASMRKASTLNLPIGLPARTSPAFGEPGIFGIFQPTLLLPEGIADCLTTQELDAIVTHELCHVRRLDNLTTAIHMAVESLFWFHPLVWWLGARLMEERERACDEEVLRLGGDPHAYAEGILKMCELYLASPLACVAGVTGGDLKKRIEAIVSNRETLKLNFGRKAFLAIAALTAIAMPIAVGIVNVGRVQAQPPARSEFEVASVKMADPYSGAPRQPRTSGGSGTSDPTRVTFTNYSMGGLLQTAFDIRFDQISGPDWFRVFGPAGILYDISATLPERTSQAEFHLMLRNLLVSRFALATHLDKKETTAYRLVKGPGALKLKPSAPDTPPDRSGGIIGNQAHRHFAHETMADLVGILSQQLGHPVTDDTGLDGEYDFELSWVASQPGEFSDGPDLPEAIHSQLGLRLEPTKGSESVLVVDHVEKMPTRN